MLFFGGRFQFLCFERELLLVEFALRSYGNVFACRHREGSCEQSGDSGHQYKLRFDVCPRNAHDEPKVGNQPVIDPEHRGSKTPAVSLTVPTLGLDDGLSAGCGILLQHQLQRPAVRTFGCGESFGFSLSHVLALIARLESADDGQHVLRSDVSRQPAEQPHPETRLIAGDLDPVVFKKFRPAFSVMHFRRRQLFEDLGPMSILLGPCKSAIERNAILFLDVVDFVSANVGMCRGHAGILTRCFTKKFAIVGAVWKWKLAVVAAVILAYAPAVNNGFIADDYMILHRIDLMKADPLYLLDVVPENFRLTSYAVFGILKSLFGYNYFPFYAFNILLHLVNCLLVRRLVLEVTGDERLSSLSALLFAVFQAPQEAVMWLAAMNETLLGFFVFLTLLLWFRERYAWAAVAFFAALFSKESAVIVLLLVPLTDVLRHRGIQWRHYLLLLAPVTIFGSMFVLTLGGNFQVGNGTYLPGPHAALVLFKSLHRLFWPWAYVVVAALLVVRKAIPHWQRAAAWGSLIVVTLSPYVFVTYTNNIPSRQVYLASAAFLPLLAAGMLSVSTRILVASFLIFNIGYMWIVKDRQMAERAAPTTALIQELKAREPGPVRLSAFPYPLAIIAKAAAVTVPGWRWDQVDLGESCAHCVVLKWDRDTHRYIAP